MTLAHELGHIVQHHHLSIPPATNVIEDEGFAFAQEFLMPAREVSAHLHSIDLRRLGQLKMYWRVSMRAILKRATDMGRISERHARRLWIMLGRSGPAEPVTIEAEPATTLRKLVDTHLTELGFTPRELSKALHQELAEFQSDFGVAANHLRLT
jgi:Zn-dependent peptidase ImmA (M78 family)